MSKRLPLVTVLLVGVAIAFAALIVKELTRVPRPSASRPQPAASVAAPAPTPAPPPAPGAASYAIVANRNLFSPTRSEAPVTPPTPPPVAATLPKPNLFGVILQDGTPTAYLEDPVTKRVARYRVGDSVAGGTVQSIEADTVMLLRPEGQVAVRLHDPARPRPAAPVPTPAPVPMPGAPTVAPPQGLVPGGVPPGSSRRALPPGVLGRVPPQPTDAPSPR